MHGPNIGNKTSVMFQHPQSDDFMDMLRRLINCIIIIVIIIIIIIIFFFIP